MVNVPAPVTGTFPLFLVKANDFKGDTCFT